MHSQEGADEVHDLLRKISINDQELKRLDQKLNDHVAKIVVANFDTSLLEELKELEEQELETAKIDLSLRQRLAEARQRTRRERLRAIQHKSSTSKIILITSTITLRV